MYRMANVEVQDVAIPWYPANAITHPVRARQMQDVAPLILQRAQAEELHRYQQTTATLQITTSTITDHGEAEALHQALAQRRTVLTTIRTGVLHQEAAAIRLITIALTTPILLHPEAVLLSMVAVEAVALHLVVHLLVDHAAEPETDL